VRLPGQFCTLAVDAFVRKYDANGTEQWTRQFGTTPGLDGVYAIALDAVAVYVGGITCGTLPGQTSAGATDAFVRKYDPNGIEQWTRQFGTGSISFPGEDTVEGLDIDATGLYVGGVTTGTLPGQTSAGATDAFVRKYDPNGTEQWTRQFGGDSVDVAEALAVNGNGLYVGGLTSGVLPGQASAGSFDAFVTRMIPPPTVLEGGIVNAASFALHPAPLAPGTIAVIFGGHLNDGTVVVSSSFGTDGRLLTTLGGASVKMNGIPAPLFYSIHGTVLDQLAVQVPFELAGQTSATAEVTVGGLTSIARTFVLDNASPGIFTLNQQGTGAGALTHLNGALVSEQDPARPAEILVLYATGLGVTSPPLDTGRPSAGNATATQATVTIDGTQAEVLFSGTTPGLVGLNQVNVRVPAGTRAGSNIPVLLYVAGKQSNEVTIAVAP
jgi:uncharacterized protein (TIGR03437 family)